MRCSSSNASNAGRRAFAVSSNIVSPSCVPQGLGGLRVLRLVSPKAQASDYCPQPSQPLFVNMQLASIDSGVRRMVSFVIERPSRQDLLRISVSRRIAGDGYAHSGAFYFIFIDLVNLFRDSRYDRPGAVSRHLNTNRMHQRSKT